MTPVPFLPALKSGNENELQTPKEPGKWSEDQSHRRLTILANAIKVPPDATEVHSLPDPWARVMLFDRALYDEEHPLHMQILGEWRGLLALLGLRERMGFQNLSAVSVQLPEAGDPQYFSAILGRVLPDDGELILRNESWRRFYVLRWMAENKRAQPVGMTSPATLVMTGAWYPAAMTERAVPWFRRDQKSGKWMLTDPVAVLSQTDRRALAAWILTVRGSVPQAETQRRGKLLKLLQDYANDLESNAQNIHLNDVLAEDRGMGLDYGLAAVLDKPHRPEMKKLSDLLIETDVPGDAQYVLIDFEAANKFGQDPREVVVYRDITLATVRNRIPQLDRSNQELLDTKNAPNMHWCKPEFFFEDYLIYEQHTAGSVEDSASNPFPGCRPVRAEGQADTRHILLPLRENVTRLFTPKTLAENFSVEWRPDGTAVCRLKIKVKSQTDSDRKDGPPSVQVRNFVLVRTYLRENCIRVQNLLAVGIWPNFRFARDPERWKRYYLFESWRGTTKTNDFIVRAPSKLLNGPPVMVTQKNNSAEESFQIQELNQFPEFLVCEMAPRNTPEGFEVRPSGLMLLKDPVLPQMVSNRAAVLGIDFGTTGTSMYWTWTDRAEPKQMQFLDRFFRITDYDQNELRRLTRDFFIPSQDWSTRKILSVFQVFTEPTQHEIRDGHVLFVHDNDPGAFIVGDEKGVRSNLKWAEGDGKDEPARGFLTQLCMQALAELVADGAGEVAIRYSYPTAFSTENRARLIGIWARVLERLSTITNIRFVDEADTVGNREAVAATRFFSSDEISQSFSISRGALTIDIGGGTTDIAVWGRNPATRRPTLTSHLSVLFAGRDIFLDLVRRKDRVLLDLDPTLPLRSLTEKTANAESYNAQLDALIADRGDKMLKELPGREEKVKDFLSIMSIGLCGLAFYAGMLAGRNAMNNSFKAGDLVPVFIGGNGSRLLRWCSINYFRPTMPMYDKFAACVLRGCQMGQPDLKAKVQLVLSPKPKEEVAYGLVAHGLGSGESDLEIHEDYTSPMAGEGYLLDSSHNDEQWSSSPSAAQMRGGISVDPKLPVFHEFLKAAKVPIDEEKLAEIANLIDDTLIGLSDRAKKLDGEDTDARALDPLRKTPVFIMALKEFTNMQIKQWVARG